MGKPLVFLGKLLVLVLALFALYGQAFAAEKSMLIKLASG